MAQLERKAGQQAHELDVLKGCLQRIEDQRMLQALPASEEVYGDYGFPSRFSPSATGRLSLVHRLRLLLLECGGGS